MVNKILLLDNTELTPKRNRNNKGISGETKTDWLKKVGSNNTKASTAKLYFC